MATPLVNRSPYPYWVAHFFIVPFPPPEAIMLAHGTEVTEVETSDGWFVLQISTAWPRVWRHVRDDMESYWQEAELLECADYRRPNTAEGWKVLQVRTRNRVLLDHLRRDLERFG